ncbi:carotenoid biosynthesis protein [Rubrobacter taiwanensis]|nr:carotenoid biosynthesis protein [Rubrobacter taiwanensis]
MRGVLPRHLLVLCPAFFLAGVLAVRFPETPGSGTASVISVAVIAAPAIAALFLRLGVRRAVISLAGLSLFAFAVEITGVLTGFPYGEFSYGAGLGPKLAGLVPYALPVAYVPLVIGAVAAAEPRASDTPGRRAGWVFSAALLLVALDGVLDPGAVRLGLWVWPEGGAYYGVPVENYLGWALSGTLAAALLLALGGWWRGTVPRPMLLDSALISLAFWAAVTAAAGLPFPALLGGVLFILFLRRRAVLSRRWRKRWWR